MKKFKAALIDDEPMALGDLSDTLQDTGLFDVCQTFSSVEECYRYGSTEGSLAFDFIFCDVELGGMPGTQATTLLRPFTTYFVLCTGHAEYAMEGHQQLVDGFLLKPVTNTYLLPLIDKLTKSKSMRKHTQVVDHIWVRRPSLQRTAEYEEEADDLEASSSKKRRHPHRDFVRIELQDIAYFERKGSQVNIMVLDRSGKYVVAGQSKTTIKGVYEKLAPTDQFLYVNASQIVRVSCIVSIDARAIQLRENLWVAVTEMGRSHVQAYLERSDISK